MVLNMIGMKFGRLTVLDQYFKVSGDGSRRDYCFCKCDCNKNPPKEYFGEFAPQKHLFKQYGIE